MICICFKYNKQSFLLYDVVSIGNYGIAHVPRSLVLLSSSLLMSLTNLRQFRHFIPSSYTVTSTACSLQFSFSSVLIPLQNCINLSAASYCISQFYSLHFSSNIHFKCPNRISVSPNSQYIFHVRITIRSTQFTQ